MPNVTIQPSDGGQLVTALSAAVAGAANWTVKRNWRREGSDEIRREGHDYFIPLPDEEDAQQQPFPLGEEDPITLVHRCQRPNGESAVVVGTKTTLYKFNSSLVGYFLEDYEDEDYDADVARWQVIGSGFSTNGNRWEAEDIAGTTVFNNGDDLPQLFRVEWDSVRPLYELREQGILSVGAISSVAEMLQCGFISEIPIADQPAILDVIRSGDITLSQAGRRESGDITFTSDGSTVTASAPFFEPGDEGRVIVWWDGDTRLITSYSSSTAVIMELGNSKPEAMTAHITDPVDAADKPAFKVVASAPFFADSFIGQKIGWADGSVRTIWGVINDTTVLVDSDTPITAAEAALENPLAFLSASNLLLSSVDVRQYRVIWGEIGDPSKMGALFATEDTANEPIVITDRTIKSISAGDAIVLVGAGTNGGVLQNDPSGNQMTVTEIGPGFIQLSASVITGGSGTAQLLTNLGGISGYQDLEDDGSGVLAMDELNNRWIVYKDTNIFIGRYTGTAAAPWEFERVVVPHGWSLHYRHTLVNIGGNVHVYAAAGGFMQFDLTSRMPSPVPNAQLVKDLFYDKASLEHVNSIFACDNHLTQEVWFITAPNSAEPIICYDYLNRTFSTSDFTITAAATIRSPIGINVRETTNWFVMGNGVGAVLIYGLVNEKIPAWEIIDPEPGQEWAVGKAIYYRRQLNPYDEEKHSYTGTLQPGRINFGDAVGEKNVSSFFIQFGSDQTGLQLPSPSVEITFLTSLNQGKTEEPIDEPFVIESGDEDGTIPLFTVCHFIRDKIETDVQYPVRISSRSYTYTRVGGIGFTKVP